MNFATSRYRCISFISLYESRIEFSIIVKRMLFPVLCLTIVPVSKAQVIIETNFAGGNVIVDSIAVDTVYFRPNLNMTEGKWFYWNFNATVENQKKWYFKTSEDNVLTGLGASFSTDGGYNWEWISKQDNISPNMFSYNFEKRNKTIRFSMGQPYTQNNFLRFIEPYRHSKNLKISILATTKKGREIERLVVSDFGKKPVIKVLITARHHACEMMSNYIIEGVIKSLLSDAPEMVDLLQKAEIMIVPFMDKDGVEDGDQGKNRLPRDHNRDYSGTSHYASTRAIRSLVENWIKNDPWLAIDLHNPWIKGKGNEHIYFVGSQNPQLEKQQMKLVEILTKTHRGPLHFGIDNFLKFGDSWNKKNNFSKGMSFSGWAGNFYGKGLILSTTLEFPYALSDNQTVSAKGTRDFGQDLIYGIKSFIDGESADNNLQNK